MSVPCHPSITATRRSTRPWIVAASLLAGCATRPADLPAGVDNAPVRAVEVERPRQLAADPIAADPRPASPVLRPDGEPDTQQPRPYPQQPPRGLRRNRFTFEGGYYGADDGALDDDGFLFNMAWTQFVSEIAAMEFEIGYLEVEGREGFVDTEAWAVPIMINGRLNLPAGPLDLYGGVGFGTMFYDAEARSLLVDVDADGLLVAGNAFVGAAVNLADAMALGIEAKYYLTEEMNNVDTDLSGYAVMLTLGFRM